MKMDPDWQKEFFSHEVVLDLWRKAVGPELTRADADFLEKMLGAEARLLDVPCGNGRHSIELARRGCRMTGVDLSEGFIAEARENARAAGVAAEFVLGDMRRLDFSGEFDGVFCFGNSFGYFDHAGLTGFLDGVSRALEQNGRFVIDTGMAAESILPNLKDREWMQVDDILFAFENRYEARESCLETEATFVRDGKLETYKWWHCVYTVAEIIRMLEHAGLETLHTFGSIDQQAFQLGNQRLLLVARKR